jgi:uncharacterized membrane protein HdeD (DUF308 family)
MKFVSSSGNNSILSNRRDVMYENKTQTLMKAVICLLIGILLCLSIIGINGFLNWMMGISLIVGGLTMITLSLIAAKTIMTDMGLVGGAILSVGVYCLPVVAGFDFLRIIAMIMMVVGALLMVDGLVGFGYKRALVGNVVVFVLGAATFTVGICLWLLPKFTNYAGVMLGIFFIINAVILFVEAVTEKEIIVIAKSKK